MCSVNIYYIMYGCCKNSSSLSNNFYFHIHRINLGFMKINCLYWEGTTVQDSSPLFPQNICWKFVHKAGILLTHRSKDFFFWNAKRKLMIEPSLQESVCQCSFLGSLLDFTNLSLQGICLQQCLVYSICPEGLRNASLLVVGHIF